MRTREKIEMDFSGEYPEEITCLMRSIRNQKILLETLLDIRDILQDKILDDLAIKAGLKK